MPTDHVDQLIAQWKRARPDLALAPMAIFGRLGRFAALATRSIEETLAEHGLNIGDFDVLATLRRSGPPHEMAPGAIAKLVMLSPAGMTSRVDRLEASGLVERRADPEDRRSMRVALTAHGLEAVDAAVGDHVDNEARLLAGLTQAERRTLDQLLRKLLAHLGDGAAPTS